MEEIKSLKVLSGLQEADEPAYTWIIHLRNCMASYAGTIIDYKEKEFIRQSILKSDYRWRNPMVENPYTRGLRSAQSCPLFNGKNIFDKALELFCNKKRDNLTIQKISNQK